MYNPLRNPFVKISLFSVVLIAVIYSCQQRKNGADAEKSVTSGKVTVYVDESIKPIVEDQAVVFESQYKAKVTLVAESESEIVNQLINQKINVAFLTRKLTAAESKNFESKKIIPRITYFATDAIAFISNKSGNDTIVDLEQIVQFLQGKSSSVKGLVFDNPNSSTVRYMDSISGVKSGNAKNVFSMKTHEEVLKYISQNPGLIGVVGLNSVVQPYPEWQSLMDKINVMGVRNVKSKIENTKYYKPSQSNIGAGLYPLTRPVYMLNYQGAADLGMGFASFIAGETGQRIILKSGLLPVRIPGRSVTIRKELLNNKTK